MPSSPGLGASRRIAIISAELILFQEIMENILRQISILMVATGAQTFRWEETGFTGSITLAHLT